MALIGNDETKMTVFFSKSTGDIKNIIKGIHDMSFYGKDADDFSIIWDYEFVDYDPFIIYNASLFEFSLDERCLKFKSNLQIMKYATK